MAEITTDDGINFRIADGPSVPTSSEPEVIHIPQADLQETRVCGDCNRTLPKHNHYFKVSPSGSVRKICHECDYAKKCAADRKSVV